MNIHVGLYVFTPRTSVGDDDDDDDDDYNNNRRVRAEKLLGSARRTMRYFAHNVPLPLLPPITERSAPLQPPLKRNERLELMYTI